MLTNLAEPMYRLGISLGVSQLGKYDLTELELEANDAYFPAHAATLGHSNDPRSQLLAWVMVDGLGSRSSTGGARGGCGHFLRHSARSPT